jgi:hypothetical protein
MAATLRRPVYPTSDQQKLRAWYNALAEHYASEIRFGRLHRVKIYDQPVFYEFLGGRGRSVRENFVDGQNQLVADVYYYVRANGTSTEPDPKALWHDGRTWVLRTEE